MLLLLLLSKYIEEPLRALCVTELPQAEKLVVLWNATGPKDVLGHF